MIRILRNTKLIWLTGCFLFVEPASAITSLKQVQVTEGSQVDLLFDGKVNKGQVRTEFFNDIIQVILTDVSVYPAKISSVSGGELSKVFAYQYAPKLVRCRLTVKGKAEAYKDQLEIDANGKMLTIRLKGSGVAKAPKVAELPTPAAAAQSTDELAAADQVILDQVMKSQAAPVQVPVAPVAAEPAKAGAKVSGKEPPSAPVSTGMLTGIGSGKNAVSFIKSFGKVIFVFGLLGLLLFGVHFYRNRGAKARDLASGELPGRVLGALKGLAARKFGVKGRLIEVIATHHLGPKRSIHVLRIGEKTLVVGATNESINLISELDSEDGLLNEYGNPPNRAHAPPPPASTSGADVVASPSGPSIFSDLLGQSGGLGRSMSGALSSALPSELGGDGIRNRIKSRLEGYKQL